MPTANLSGLVHRYAHDPDVPTASDGELLNRFVAVREEAAFAELVRRYGPLVLAVCRRVTGDRHLAEDAFQAVFVVLATKAASVRAGALPAWLHAVATRTALRARTVAHRRRKREMPLESSQEPADRASEAAEEADLAAVVDEEIARLPDTLRAAVVLCELEGYSRKEAAARLSVPEGTVSSRLAAARKVLAVRLQNRGLVLGAAGLSAALGTRASASVPAGLGARALASALSPVGAPAAVAALSTGVLRVMFAQKLKVVLPVTALALAALACAALAASHNPPAPQPPAPKPPMVVFAPRAADPVPAKPLPKGPNKLLFFRDGDIVLIDPDGKNDKTVSKDRDLYHAGTLLSPDGKRIATLIIDPIPPKAPDTGRRTATLHVRGLEEKEPGVSLGVKGQTFAWAPDGTEIVCSDFDDGPPDKEPLPVATTVIVNVETKKTTVLKLPDNHIVSDWSRDGKYFLTSSMKLAEGEPTMRQHLMNRDGTEAAAVGDAKTVSTFGRLSPDGKRVLCFRLDFKTAKDKKAPFARRELVVIDIATQKVAKVDEVPLNAEIQGYCWSPDGKRIAYSWREVHEGKPEDVINKETESHLVICDPDGKNQKTIASEKGKGQWIVTIGTVDWR
jgi:RNA polymerase sigma factor (sigma-70 family)